ncbi:hypothetical protein CALCODRAFT_181240 [Calocera cornea HHB12733]|uniref:Mitochondrial import inner membrane translocase subunit TIM50 n=1 Tax=Calocera cornea HHB12733 TaxID=1353952 RepID=A0A165HRC3_9BASI|nr:hypothetical protein CALCODRAFT_181240 [Calocera cornea HHB12733]
MKVPQRMLSYRPSFNAATTIARALRWTMDNNGQQRRASFNAVSALSTPHADADVPYNPSQPELPPLSHPHQQSPPSAEPALPANPLVDTQWLASTLRQVAPLLNSIAHPSSTLSPLAASAAEHSPESEHVARPFPLSDGHQRSDATAFDSASGPAQSSEKPTKLSAKYLARCSEPSRPVDSPTVPHLLILDLNGTLLVRLPKTHNGSKRTVRPRPYLRAFLRYLFDPDPEQKSPLWNVMVWSSAQPQNVGDMVSKAFGVYSEKLTAVWARDTLGLPAHDYNRKVQTTKDLEKVWKNIPSPWDPLFSALNTILLDDSPLKAHLQPHNHLPLIEYTVELLRRDEAALNKVFNQQQGKGKGKAKAKAQIQDDEPTSGPDQHLLAVIGILDTVVHQSSACGWIRSGGLWTGREQAQQESARAAKVELLRAKMQTELDLALQKGASGSSTSPSDMAVDPRQRELELREMLKQRNGSATPTSPTTFVCAYI